jgi:O-antigen/teichoic acid export membrane protein/peptidoglycan/xylan/chitin deacetylase (PgdA/CDA1 family)
VLALATTGLVASVVDVTVEQGIVHHGFRALSADDIPGLKALIRNGVILDLAVGAAVTAAVFALAGPMSELASHGALTVTILQFAALRELAGTLDPSTAAVLQLGERQDLRGWSMAIGSGTRLAAIIVAVVAGAGAEGLVAAFAVATALGSLVQILMAWAVIRNRWPHAPRRGGMREAARKLLPFAVHSSLTTTLLSASNSLLPVILGRVAGTSAVGLFRVARLPVNAAAIGAAPLQLMMFAEMTKRAADGRVEELRKLIGLWNRIAFAIAGPAVVAGFFLMPWLIPTLYGQQFDGAVTTAQIMLIPGFVGFTFAWMKNFMASIGRPQVASRLALAPLFVAVPITALFADDIGSEAAAAGAAAAAVIMCTGNLLVTRRWFRRQMGHEPRRRARGAWIGEAVRRLPAVLQRPLLAAAAWLLRLSGLRAGAAIAWHRVGDPAGDPARELMPALGTDVFAAQLRHLRRLYRVVPARELPEAARARRRGQRFPVALTFDDDLASHADVAAPILRRQGLPATFFLTGATLREPTTFWWERLQVAVDEQLVTEGWIESEGIHAAAKRVVDSAPPERDELLRTLERIPATAEEGLPAEAVRTLARDGLEVGFHTLRHATLTTLDDEELERALRDGRDDLEGVVGGPLSTIAYPHGRADERVGTASRAAGFRLGYTTRPRAVVAEGDPMLLGRLQAPFGSANLALELLRLLARARKNGRS